MQIRSFEKRLCEILQDKRILLIDDDAMTVGWKVTLDTLFGNNVLEAVYGEWKDTAELLADQGLAASLRSDNHLIPYDLILLDLYLTKKDEEIKRKYPDSKPLPGEEPYGGLILLHEIRKKDITVPVILFTATTRTFNVEDAEKIGIDGYFQKEDLRAEEEYYIEFRNLIERCISQEKIALRCIWSGIKNYEEQLCAPLDIISDLKDAHSLLEGYLKKKDRSYLRASILLLADVIEKMLEDKEDKRLIGHYAFDAVLDDLSTKKNIRSFYPFIVCQIRNSFAHAGPEITFEDFLFAFTSLLNFVGINVVFNWIDPYPNLKFNENVAENIINAICSKVCKKRKKRKKCYSYISKDADNKCTGPKRKSIEKAKFLSLPHNLKNNTSLPLISEVIFRYLFSMLYYKELNQSIPEFMLHLIKSRLKHDSQLDIGGKKLCEYFLIKHSRLSKNIFRTVYA